MLAPPPRSTRWIAGLTVGAALAAYLSAAASAARLGDPAGDRPPASCEDRVYDPRSMPTVDAGRTCDGSGADAIREVLTHETVLVEPAALRSPVVLASCDDDAAGDPREYGEYWSPGFDLGQAVEILAPDPARASDVPVRLAFGLTGDGDASTPGRVAGGAVWIVSADAPVPRRAIAAPPDVTRFGEALVAIDDVDGDGAPDLVVAGARRRSRNGPAADRERTRFFVASSGRGVVLRAFEETSEVRSAVPVAVPDQDGDGLRDVAWIARASLERGPRARHHVWIVVATPATGRTIRGLHVRLPRSDAGGGRYHLAPHLLASLSGGGDGPDLLILGARPLTAIDLASGDTAWVTDDTTAWFERAFAIPDVDGDGARDLAAGRVIGNDEAELVQLSARDGSTRRVIGPFDRYLRHEFNGALGADTDGDGAPESYVTSIGPFGGVVVELCGRTGHPRRSFLEPLPYENGEFVRAGFDWDDDGAPDVMVAGYDRRTGGVANGVSVFSPKRGCLLLHLRIDDVRPSMPPRGAR